MSGVNIAVNDSDYVSLWFLQISGRRYVANSVCFSMGIGVQVFFHVRGWRIICIRFRVVA